jgi:hypothetical protein
LLVGIEHEENRGDNAGYLLDVAPLDEVSKRTQRRTDDVRGERTLLSGYVSVQRRRATFA